MTHGQWPTRRLESLCRDITVGFVGSMSHEFVDQGVPLLRGQNVRPYRIDLDVEVRYISREFHSKLRKSQLRAGDVVIVRVGYPGVAAVIPEGMGDLNCASLVVVRPDPSLLDSRYLTYFLNSSSGKAVISGRLVGSAQQVFNTTSATSLELPYPSMREQRGIVDILSAYDDLIDNNTKRIKLLEEMVRSLYREWFVHLRFPGHRNSRGSVSSAASIPDGWGPVRLEQLYVTASGGTPSRKHPEYFAPAGAGIPWVKTKELFDGWIVATEEDLSAKGLENSSAKVFPAGTLLVAMYGATIGQLGILAIPATTNQACCAVLPSSDRSAFRTSFAWCYFKENRQRIASLGLGAAQPNISQTVIRGLEMLRPPDSLAARFDELCAPFLTSMRNLEERSANLRRTRDILLPRLISGEIDVSNLPDPPG